MDRLIAGFSKHKWFLFFVIFAIFLRAVYVWDDVVAFSFDHGKDSIAVMHMLVAQKLKFIGPWTSIPGVFFGPGWYYLLAPFYLISGFNPVSAVWAMIILIVIQMYLAYRYFGLYEAIIISSSGVWITISRSAWNPFPMTMITLLVLILLKKQLVLNKIDNKIFFWMFFVASLGFHFSAAFAIFYPIIIILILILNNFRPNLKAAINGGLGFAIPFIPQMLFELKNSFVETRALINYFKAGGSDDVFSLNKILNVVQSTIGEFRILLAFDVREFPKIINESLFMILLLSLFVVFIYSIKDSKFKNIFAQRVIFISVPIIGFFFLHFNIWYILALIPVLTIFFSELLRKSPKIIAISYLSLLVLSSISNLFFYLEHEKSDFMYRDDLLPVKKKIVSYIRENAGDRSFSVYTYLPNIYDYDFQYLLLSQGLNGEKLPVEFSYKAGEINYVNEKISILEKINQRNAGQNINQSDSGGDLTDYSKNNPEIIYYIVKKEESESLLNSWWNQQNYSKIINKKQFGENLTVMVAKPKSTETDRD